MTEPEIVIAGRAIGRAHPPYVIAELSGNHNGELERAAQLVRVAAEAGADAVKVQTYTADTLTIDADTQWFTIGEGTLWSRRRLHDLYAEAATPWEWFPELQRVADDAGIAFFSTPFDSTAVEFHEQLGLPAHKIASFEIVDHELIACAAATGRPLLMSTGMASVAEIDEAVQVARQAGCEQLALLHCNSAYPAPVGEMHLRTIPHLGQTWGVPSGLSDHSLGIAVAVAAVALGASIIEKHVTLARADGGPDSAFSLEPDEFHQLVVSVADAHGALGGVHYGPTVHERNSLAFRRSLFVVADVPEGGTLTRDNVRSIRPGHGLPPKYLPTVLGRSAVRPLERGMPLSWADLA